MGAGNRPLTGDNGEREKQMVKICFFMKSIPMDFVKK